MTALMKTATWRSIPRESPLLAMIDTVMAQAQLQVPNRLSNLRYGRRLMVGTDFGGHHRESAYEAITFVIADIENSPNWLHRQTQFRRERLRDGRRMAYKSLNDRMRMSVLPEFLINSSELRGLTITLLIDKRLKSLFAPTYLQRLVPSPPEKPRWNEAISERLMRTVHFLSFFLAGLCSSGQDVLWVVDEDAIVPNEDRVRDLCNVFANISSTYLDQNLGHFRLATTRHDFDRQMEDFVAISDLIAGATAELATQTRVDGVLPSSQLLQPVPKTVSQKARRVGRWLSIGFAPLKHLVVAVEPEGPHAFSVTEFMFPKDQGLR